LIDDLIDEMYIVVELVGENSMNVPMNWQATVKGGQ
jgi:hypothetical protein